MMTRLVLLTALSVIDLGSIARAQPAGPYPNHPIKMIVPFAPGGADLIARLIGERITTALGQPVVIENRPGGAGGTVGTKSVAIADPDGYTLTLASPGPITVAPAVNKTLDYDPLKQLTAVAMIARSAFVLVMNPDIPANTLREFIAYAKANPGKINFVSPGFGTSSHLFGELLKQRTGVDIIHIPYRGSAPAIVDLVAGQVQLYFDNVRNLKPFIQSGKLRALGVTSDSRTSELPDVPTMKEAGVEGIVGFYWNGVLAPAATPTPIIEKLSAAINDGLRTSAVKENLAKLGMDPIIGSPQDFTKLIADEYRGWAAVARAANF